MKGTKSKAPKVPQAFIELIGDHFLAAARYLREIQDEHPDDFVSIARKLLNEVSVKPHEIRICGSKAVLARSAANGPEQAAPTVLSFVREWCAPPGEDDNYVYSIAL